MRLWIYSVSCCALSSIVPVHGSKKRTYQDEILLWCVDETLCTYLIQVNHYKTHILLLPKRSDVCKIGLDNIKPSHFPESAARHIERLDVWRDSRVLFSYTKSKIKPVILAYLKNERNRKDVIKSLKKNKMLIGCIGIKEILHTQTRPEVQFLQSSGLRYQAWFETSQSTEVYDTKDLLAPAVRHSVVDVRNLHYDKATGTTNAPILRKLYLRIFAHSSTATVANQFDPADDIAEDEVRYVAYLVSGKTVESYNVLDYTQYTNGEKALLTDLGTLIAKSNIQVIVYASDEHTKPNALFYLQKRALRHGVNLHLSKLSTLQSKCEVRECENASSSYLVFEHQGTERIDLCCVLQKAMVSPPLDGFTLLDALRHDKLIRNKAPFDRLLQLNYHGLNSFSSHQTIRSDLALFVRLLWTLERDNDFLVSQQNISHICDSDITSVSERGQQLRVRNLFCRKLVERHIVINADKTKQQYLIVKKPQAESDFPNPEWLENPPVASLRGAEMPQHILKEPIVPHLKAIVDLPHNNVLFVPPSPTSLLPPSSAVPPPSIEFTSMDDLDFDQIIDRMDTEKEEAEDDQENEEEEAEEKKETPRCELASIFLCKGKHAIDFEKKPKVSKRKKKETVVRYFGGLVLDAMIGFYTKPEQAAGTWDFGSLYPSIMQGFLLCYMRIIFKKKWLEDPKLEKQYIPITETECVVYAKSYDGEAVETVLPDIVRDIVELRQKTREQQKKFEEGTFEWMTLEGRQLAAKVVQNSVYGFTGSETSGMTCTALAAAVTNIGRWMNRTVRFVILFLGGWIYYGDTDSVMARFWIPPHCTTPDEIFAALYEKCFLVQKFATALFPKPNKLEFEAVKKKFFLLGKKVYAAIQMSAKPQGWKLPPDAKPNIKGFTAKKRDKCEHAQRIGLQLIYRLLYTEEDDSFEQHVEWYREELRTISLQCPKRIEELSPWIITCALNSEYKNEKSVLAPALANMIAKESGARPRPGTRLPFVLIRGPKLRCDKAVTPNHFLQHVNQNQIDIPEYLSNQIYKSVKQILALDVHEQLRTQFQVVTQSFVHMCNNRANKIREIDSYFRPVAKQQLAS